MKIPSKFTCIFAASFMTVTPYTPQQFLHQAKEQTSVADKISILRRLFDAYPTDNSTAGARDHLIDLLIDDNRYEEALTEYRKDHPETLAARPVDFKLAELLLRTGRYNELLKETMVSEGPTRDILRDMKVVELRIQALLSKGQFQAAQDCVDRWLQKYRSEAVPGGRFEGDVRSMQFLKRHLQTLERLDGPIGKAIFTATAPDSMQHWSRRQDVPIVFFKLIPAHPAGQMSEPLLPGRHEGDAYFENRVYDINRGFNYLSGGQFSLRFAGLHTLYVKEGDIDPESSGGHLITSRVYVHTIPQLYKLAGDAFAVLVDYRQTADGEAAYMGDGLIHLSASRLETLVVIHEILHGLGATHQEWNSLEAQGYRFDPEDRGVMTFDHGQILDLGLEEKNRAVVGWPRVAVVRPTLESNTAITEGLRRLGNAVADQEPTTVQAPLQRPDSSELLPAL